MMEIKWILPDLNNDFKWFSILVVPLIISLALYILVDDRIDDRIPVSTLYYLSACIVGPLVYCGLLAAASICSLCFLVWKMYGLPGMECLNLCLPSLVMGLIAFLLNYRFNGKFWANLNSGKAKFVLGVILALYINIWVTLFINCEIGIERLYGNKWIFLFLLLIIHIPFAFLGLALCYFVIVYPILWILGWLFSQPLTTFFWNYFTLSFIVLAIEVGFVMLAAALGLIDT